MSSFRCLHPVSMFPIEYYLIFIKFLFDCKEVLKLYSDLSVITYRNKLKKDNENCFVVFIITCLVVWFLT